MQRNDKVEILLTPRQCHLEKKYVEPFSVVFPLMVTLQDLHYCWTRIQHYFFNLTNLKTYSVIAFFCSEDDMELPNRS